MYHYNAKTIKSPNLLDTPTVQFVCEILVTPIPEADVQAN